MFIDFLSLLLVNMAAGLVLLAWFVYAGLPATDRRPWAPSFALVGFIAVGFGGYLTMTWPLPGPFNAIYGELSVLFGGLFLFAALTMALGWDLLSLTVFAFFAGVASVVSGLRIYDLKLTPDPLLPAIGFVLTGLVGMCAAPMLRWFATNRPVRIVAVIIILMAALIWGFTGYMAYWMHPKMQKDWMPVTMRQVMPSQK